MNARELGVQDEQLLVICRANVARSPLVAGLLRLRLESLGRSDLTVVSAGLEAAPQSPATEEVVHVAEELGVDLAGHKAASVTEEMVLDAALVLTMTESQRDVVQRMARSTVPYTFTLAELIRLIEEDDHGPSASWSTMARQAHRARPLVAPSPHAEDVPDPVGQSERHYRALAGRLAAMSEQVVSHLAGRPFVRPG